MPKNVTGMRSAAKSLAADLKKRWGPAWYNLGPTFQHALAAERVLHVFIGRDEEYPIAPAQIREYLDAVWAELGLE